MSHHEERAGKWDSGARNEVLTFDNRQQPCLGSRNNSNESRKGVEKIGIVHGMDKDSDPE